MARHFTVTLTSGTNNGPYTIYHTSSTNGNQALLYGTTNQATGLTLAQVQGGVLITVPDNATSVIFYNTNGNLISNCPTNIVEYPLSPSGTPHQVQHHQQQMVQTPHHHQVQHRKWSQHHTITKSIHQSQHHTITKSITRAPNRNTKRNTTPTPSPHQPHRTEFKHFTRVQHQRCIVPMDEYFVESVNKT